MYTLTDAELLRINNERARRGQPGLTREQVERAVRSREAGYASTNNDMVNFLIMYSVLSDHSSHPTDTLEPTAALGSAVAEPVLAGMAAAPPEPPPVAHYSYEIDAGGSDSGGGGGDSGGGGGSD